MSVLCYICLLDPQRVKIHEETRAIEWLANEAVTYVAGTAVCKDHIRSIANEGVLAVVEEQPR